MSILRPLSLALLALLMTFSSYPAAAAIVATGFFSGTIEQFDSVTGTQSTFANLASVSDPFPGLSGIAFDSSTNTLYASARISNRIYRVDAVTGAVLGFTQLAGGTSPASLTVDNNGNVYVANNGSNSISVLNSSGTLTGSISLPDVGLGDNFPSGLAFDPSGRLIVSTFAGAGLFQVDPVSGLVTPFAAGPTANGQVASDANGNIYVGGAAFSNDVLKFASDGSAIGSPLVTIDASLLPQPLLGYASPDFTSPSGVTIDSDGNLIVSALGRTNPTSAGDNFQSNGGLWKFSPTGTLLQTFGTAGSLTPLSSVTSFTIVPEPGILSLLVVGITGVLLRRRRGSNRV